MMYIIHHDGKLKELFKKLADEGVLGVDEVVEGAREDEAAFFKHEVGGAGIEVALGKRNHVLLFGVPGVRGEGEGVLQAVGDDERGGSMDVALLDDELDDLG
jgi:hypothetical protein